MSSRRITFSGSGGGDRTALLALPAGRPAGTAVFAHGSGSGGDAVVRVARALAERGLAVLALDVAGGTAGSQDVVLAAEHLRATVAPTTLLLGHALGGAAVLAAGARLPDVAAVVTIGAPGDAEHAAALHRPLLVLHSPTDQVVGVDDARILFDAARHPKSFVALDGADHLLTDPRDADFAADVVAAWMARHLPVAPVEPGPGGGAVVTGTSGDGLRHTVLAGGHRMVLDEPVPIGTDLGPTPYDALLAALGGCTAMTVRMYAQRKGWPLDDVTVALRHDRLHTQDCADCETAEGRVDRIRREITLDGPLDDEQRTRLLEMADRCPVHRTLLSEIKIETSEAGGAR